MNYHDVFTFHFLDNKKWKKGYREGILCYPHPYSSVRSLSNLVYSKFTSIASKVRSNTGVTFESGVAGRGDFTHVLSIKN